MKNILSKKSIFIALLTVLSFVKSFGQSNDSIVYNRDSLTICACAMATVGDIEVVNKCKAKYSIKEMTKGRLKEYYSELSSCRKPSICDCYEGSKDWAFMDQCEERFNLKKLTKEELQKLKSDLEECKEKKEKVVHYTLRDICNCVNADGEGDGRLDCEEIFDLSDKSEEERINIISKMEECAANKEDELFLINICDCIELRVSDEDKKQELKEKCLKKYNILELNDEQLKKIRIDAALCD